MEQKENTVTGRLYTSTRFMAFTSLATSVDTTRRSCWSRVGYTSWEANHRRSTLFHDCAVYFWL